MKDKGREEGKEKEEEGGETGRGEEQRELSGWVSSLPVTMVTSYACSIL